MTKLALITGSSEGLGRCFAKELAHRGFLTINVARNEERLKELVAELGEGHQYAVADLSLNAGVEQCLKLIVDNDLDLLVNNAGFSQFGLFRDADIDAQTKIFEVNCFALMRLSHAFLKKANSGDGLINLSSITNDLTTPIQPTYCASKCFIASFSESLWFQERERGVYVQALLPGITKTEFIRRSSDLEGFKMRFLDGISQSPEAVVNTSLNALAKRKGPIVVPGVHNKLMAMLLRLLPRKWVVYAMGTAGSLAQS